MLELMRDLPSNQRNSLFGVSAMFVPFPIWRSCFVVPGVGWRLRVAARQQFAGVTGYESENLRRERDQLLQDQQRLLLQRECSVPTRLESAARQLGLRPVQAGQVGKPQVNGQSPISVRTGLIHPSASLTR